MATRADRKRLNPTSVVLKQASMTRALERAQELHERGELEAAALPPGVSRPPVRKLRVTKA